jgi:hypothetical protein
MRGEKVVYTSTIREGLRGIFAYQSKRRAKTTDTVLLSWWFSTNLSQIQDGGSMFPPKMPQQIFTVCVKTAKKNDNNSRQCYATEFFNPNEKL